MTADRYEETRRNRRSFDFLCKGQNNRLSRINKVRGPMLNQGRGAPLSHLPPPHPTGLYKYICFLKTICFSSYTVLLKMHMNFTSIHPFYSLSSFTIFFFLSLFSRVHATLQPALSVGPLVPWSICPQVRQPFFLVADMQF